MSLKEKKCFLCKNTLPLEMFYKHPKMKDGHLGKCKNCAKKDVKSNYAKRRAYYSQYEKERYKNPKRKLQIKESLRRQRAANPEKARHRDSYKSALSAGKLQKTPCIHCGAKKVQGHHDDYSKPFDVKWVCFKCHREIEHGQVVTYKDE